ncbi:MAG: PHP domain-containing protein [Nanoarchaeota archaeon]|nr:PHP domain-containing protein [Nanoarchaeota archaeon]
MKKYDLHIHSCYSPCSINRPEDILKRAKKAGLNGIAITDHGIINGAQKIKRMNKDKGFEVIIGEEVRTDKGDILALYIQEQIKIRNLSEVIDNVKSQDGILIIAHPFRWVPWLRFEEPIKNVVGKIDGVETFNSRNIGWANKKAEKSIDGLDFAEIGASDAHIPIDIGKGYTLAEGNLKDAIKKRQTKAQGTTRYALLSALISTINGRILSPLKVKKQWV